MNTTTVEKMSRMRLWGMLRAFKTSLENPSSAAITADEMVAILVDSEWDDRYNRSIERNIHNARFRYKATFEQIEYTASRGLDKNHIHRLADGDFVRKNIDLLITGSTGTGKSFLASAIGHQCCLLGFKVLYANATRLFAQLKMSKADGSIVKELMKIEKQDLLILDDFGLQTLDAQSRSLLMDIIEDRHGIRSTIITSQLPIKQWHDVIGEKTVADAILDRIVHGADRIELKGESLRRKAKKNIDPTNENYNHF